MTSAYPGSLDSFTRQTGSGTLAADNGLTHKDYHDNAFDAIEAIETELGTDPAGIFSTVRARLDAIDIATASSALFDYTATSQGKTSDTDATDNTYGHSIAVEANVDYLVRGALLFAKAESPNAASDVRVRFAVPTGATLSGAIWGPSIGDTPLTYGDQTIPNMEHLGHTLDAMAGQNFPFAILSTVYGAGPTVIEFMGILEMSTTAGNFLTNWAQQTSSAVATNIVKGSHTRLERLV